MSTGLSWGILLAAFAALCFLSLTIGVLVMIFRAATRASSHPPGEAPHADSANVILPSVVGSESPATSANPVSTSFDSGGGVPPCPDTGDSGSGHTD